MKKEAKLSGLLSWSVFFLLASAANGQQQGNLARGEGVDSQVLWATAGPSNFPTVESSDIMDHTNVAFSGLFQFYGDAVGAKEKNILTGKETTHWAVERAFVADFLWGFGLFDIFQLGVTLPVVLEQKGEGAEPVMPVGAAQSDYALSSSSLMDLRTNIKTRFLGGDAEIPDRRDWGLGFDLGISLPTGDELDFAGDKSVVFFPTVVVDFHRCKFSAAINLGARLRLEKGEWIDKEVGQQGVFGLGVTGHYFEKRLMLSLESTGVLEFDGVDRIGVEYRGGVGYFVDDARAIALWLSGGSSFGTGDLLGTPVARVLFRIVYAPGASKED
jgi:hypothetical protein